MKQPLLLTSFILLLTLHASAQLTYNELTLQLDSVWSYNNLALIPVKFKSPPANTQNGNVLSFQQAMHTGKLSVKEMITPEGSDINVLLIKNHTKKNVLVNSGEMIKGGKQDRVAATTSIIPPGEDFYLSVYCMEKGRWSDKIKNFSYAGTADVQLKKQIDVLQKQNDVWKEIDQQYKSTHKLSDTWPYLNLYNELEPGDSNYIKYFIGKMQHSDSSFAGFLAVSDDQIINCELFSDPNFCLLSYTGLINSYLRSISTKEQSTKVSTDAVFMFCNRFMRSNEQQQNYVPSHGRIDKYKGSVIHVVVYE